MGSFLDTLGKIGAARLFAIAVVAAAMIGFFAYIETRLTAPNFALLYSDLDLKDSSQVAAKLDAANIPYQIKGDGAAIYVPSEQVGRLRLTMAESGIPHGASIGYEIFDKSDALGATNFQQGVNEMRALEGELSRTIQSLSVVDSARVHLVLPKRELFSREKQEPSASVVLKTRGATLSKTQIAAILNLVATAVPALKTSRISIIDQNGNLLARGGDSGNDTFGNGISYEEQRVGYETKLTQNVEEMLERSIGFGHVRVDVNADMDFDRITTSQESYDPGGQVVRSTQTTNEANESSQPEQGVSVQNNVPNQAAAQPAGTNAVTTTKSKDNKTEETTNYEISKKITSQTREAGIVKRLSVAILIDGTYATGANGERTYTPRTAEDIAMLTKLVQSAIGYDEKRGDRVEIVNMRFAAAEEVAAAMPSGFFGLEKSDLFRIGETGAALLIAVLLILLVARPLIKGTITAILQAPSAGQPMLAGPAGAYGALPPPTGTAMVMREDGEEDGHDDDPENMINISQVDGRVKASSMRKIGEIVEKHPDEAVSIIRSWMYQAT